MKNVITVFLIVLTNYSFSQICPVVEKRNNGNGQSNSCAGVSGTPMAPNMIGTPYSTNFIGLSKTGDIKFRFSGAVTNPPAIKKIWIGSTLSAAVAGPASVPIITDSYTTITYCFYNVNLPPSGVYTLEFVNPQTDEMISLCGFSGSSNSIINPPIITSDPQSQSSCIGGTVTFSVSAQPSNSGFLTYQWRKSGIDIIGATSSKYTILGITSGDTGDYDCRVGETTGTFVLSTKATLKIISCSNNSYIDQCGSGSLITTATNSWNNAWIDFDNDNREDLFITNKNEDAPNFLYKNTLTDFTAFNTSPLTTTSAKTNSSAWADIDNDGDPDVLIINSTQRKSEIYENKGSGMFTLLSTSGIDNDPQYFHGAAWSDFNNDGFVDLLITNFFETRFHHLYKNNGNKTFTRIFNSTITSETNRSTAPILADYDNDGLTDVFIPNGNDKPNSLFRNLGNFQFEKITAGAIATDSYNSVGACWGDYNNDGWQDLFVANASNQNNNLYENNGDGTFIKITSSVVVNDGGHSHGANFIDIENDGDLDLFVTNDEGPNFLYINDGTGNFSRVMDEAIATDLGMTYGQAWADYNKDGVLDVMISTHSDQLDKLFCGKDNSNHWINIKLQGSVSNFSSIGTQIRLKAGGKWQVRQVNPISGFGSQNSLRQHFGIGTNTTIDSIQVDWPSGIKQFITNLSPDIFITIVEEDASDLTLITYHDNNNNCIKDISEAFVPGIALLINPIATRTATNENGIAEIWLRDGAYSIDLNNEPYWQLGCPVSLNANTSTIYIPLQKTDTRFDLAITLGTSAWRRGFKNQTVVTYKNMGTTAAENITISLQYPSEVVVESSEPVLAEVGIDQYTIDIARLNPGEWGILLITDSVTLNSFVGQELILTGMITAGGGDAQLANNTAIQYKEVVGAIDPNDMAVYPKGEGLEGFIFRTQRLTYTIRFENVGTYAASFVALKNRLPSNLDLSTFQVESSSHSYQYTLQQNGVLQVKFKNINLPSSSTNKIESHGFFTYSAMPIQKASVRDQITNFASIVFDYEDPIPTNSVLNTILGNSDTQQLIAYPNPASGLITITWKKQDSQQNSLSRIQHLLFYDQRGVDRLEFTANDIKVVDISTLQAGFYILKATDQFNTVMYAKLVVR
jgi:ASPIC and UnbV/FG-GAP-like repeat/Secretion system C-terminal sorting domain